MRPPSGEVVDRVYCHVDAREVHFCPGDRQYFGLEMRKGFRDAKLFNAGEGGGEAGRRCVVVGGGKIAVPVT